MITLPLRMTYHATPLRPAAAWVLPGGNAAVWLDELLQWGIPLAAVTLYAVPRRRGDTSPAGALAVPGSAIAASVSRRCQPYGRIAGEDPASPAGAGAVYLPVEAQLDPAATQRELAAVLAEEPGVYLLHPAVGLVRFSDSDGCRVSDLLCPVPAGPAAWGRASPGVSLSRRLLAIEPATVPTVEMILSEGQGEIGSRPLSAEQLPRSPEEPTAGGFGMGCAIRLGIARLVAWMGSKRPAPGEPGKRGRLGQWAQRQLDQLDRSLFASRHREILRLLHLLKTNPEEGLRYALPLHSGDHRGIAPPGARLGYRDIDFNLGRLRGGEPADPWDVPFDFQTRLTALYHELAAREIRLGRHRRAAYIYAELLGDLGKAAAILKAGRHFREAAVLYRERLKQPGEAARCLEEGGLWVEAIALYEERAEFEKVGDLYVQLDQAEQAREAYGRAVAKHRRHRDYLTAARILESKLADCDGAIACLEAGWPASHQASQCLESLFGLLGRHGRHETANAKIEQLRAQKSPSRRIRVVEMLSRFARTYPDRPVQAAAADATRTLAAGCLRSVSQEDRLSVLAAVRRLVPEDRLLGRDCDRFLTRSSSLHGPQRPQPRPSQPARPAAALTLLRVIKLPEPVDWWSAVSAEGAFYAAGYGERTIVVAQGFWDGTRHLSNGESWRYTAVWRPPILLAFAGQRCRVAIRILAVGREFPWRSFPPTDHLPQSIEIGTPPWLSNRAVAVQRTGIAESSILEPGPTGLTLSSYSRDDQPLGSRFLAWSDIWPDGDGRYQLPPLRQVPFHMRDDVCLALENRLVLWRPDSSVRVIDVGETIVGLHRSARHSRARIAVALEHGAVLYWDEFQDYFASFAEGMPAPMLQFVPGGWLVAASEQECRVYRTADNHQIHCEAGIPFEHGRPVAVLSTGQAGQFAMVTQEGTVAIYQTPKR